MAAILSPQCVKEQYMCYIRLVTFKSPISLTGIHSGKSANSTGVISMGCHNNLHMPIIREEFLLQHVIDSRVTISSGQRELTNIFHNCLSVTRWSYDCHNASGKGKINRHLPMPSFTNELLANSVLRIGYVLLEWWVLHALYFLDECDFPWVHVLSWCERLWPVICVFAVF